MVDAQARLLDHLGIEQLFSVVGGSMGGMQVLEWAARYTRARLHRHPDRDGGLALGAEHRLPRGRPAGRHGRPRVARRPLSDEGTLPRRGLAVARMAAHITYLSEEALQRKFGRSLQDREAKTFSFDADFQVESYLRHQGSTFVDRFDANSYLYITRAMDYFDLAAEHGGSSPTPSAAPRRASASSPSPATGSTRRARAKEIVQALNAVAANVVVRRGRERQGPRRLPARRAGAVRTVRGFLNAAARKRGIAAPRGTADARRAHEAVGGRASRRPSADRRDGGAGARVLDVGCGDGALLQLLAETKDVDGRGIEIAASGSTPAWRAASR